MNPILPSLATSFNPLTIPSDLTHFPNEIIMLVCQCLNSVQATLQLALVNQKCYQLILKSPESALLWNSFLHKYFPHSCANLTSTEKNSRLYKELTEKEKTLKGGQDPLQTFTGHQEIITCLDVEENHLFSGSGDSTIKIWNLHDGTLLQTLREHGSDINCLKIIKDPSVLAGKLISGASDSTIKIWNPSNGVLLQTLKGHEKAIECILILEEKETLISSSWDCTIKIWNLHDGTLVHNLRDHEEVVTCMKTINNLLISGSGDHTLKIWDLNTGTLLQTLKEHRRGISCIEIAENGQLISGSWDRTITIWDLSNGTLLHTLIGHQNAITCIKSMKDRLISSSWNSIKIWNLSTGELIQTLSGHQGDTSQIDIIKDQLIATSLNNIYIWDLSNGELTQILLGHEESISSIKLAGYYLITGAQDFTIKMWNLALLFDHLALKKSSKETDIDCQK